MSAKGDKTHRYQIRLQAGTAEALAAMAAALGFLVETPGRYQGNPSPGDFLDKLTDEYTHDPTAVLACLRGVGVAGEPGE